MDADEFLSEELKEKLPTLIKGKEIDAYAFLWKVWNGKKYLTKNSLLKLFSSVKKNGIYHFPRKRSLYLWEEKK